MSKQVKTEVPNTAPKPTETPKAQLADKVKSQQSGQVIKK